MNAAARLAHQGALSRHLVLVHLLTRRQLAIASLAMAILFSAIGIIYVTHLTRVLYATYQHQLAERNQLHIERGQLLLERGAWMMQARIQQVAETKLGMVIPDHKSVVIVRE